MLSSYCLMPNRRHFVLLWSDRDSQLSEFLRLLTVIHTQRWYAAHGTASTGPLYQGRFKKCPVEDGGHVLQVSRYVEQNPLRANLAPSVANCRGAVSPPAGPRTDPHGSFRPDAGPPASPATGPPRSRRRRTRPKGGRVPAFNHPRPPARLP